MTIIEDASIEEDWREHIGDTISNDWRYKDKSTANQAIFEDSLWQIIEGIRFNLNKQLSAYVKITYEHDLCVQTSPILYKIRHGYHRRQAETGIHAAAVEIAKSIGNIKDWRSIWERHLYVLKPVCYQRQYVIEGKHYYRRFNTHCIRVVDSRRLWSIWIILDDTRYSSRYNKDLCN